MLQYKILIDLTVKSEKCFFPLVFVEQETKIAEILKKRIWTGIGGWNSFEIKIMKGILMCGKDTVTKELQKDLDVQFKLRVY